MEQKCIQFDYKNNFKISQLKKLKAYQICQGQGDPSKWCPVPKRTSQDSQAAISLDLQID